ncbi:FIMAH domain-containing protein [Paenibacillus chungangensis]|uniref:FIMAH domain-containing protein n=1 Tax=Paenibacillus chungangensis TaxID=696535 RepID=A0ABW3HU92_9BACL
MRTFRTVLTWLTIVALLAGNLTWAANKAQAETEDTVTTVYSFADLVTMPNDPAWHVDATNPVNMRVTAYTIQLINNDPQPDVNGEYITINFYVPESRYYDLDMVYRKNIAGGYADIAIDDQTLVTGHSFYNPLSTDSTLYTSNVATGLQLSKGIHTLTFTANDTVQLPSNGNYYLYLYLQQFELIGKEPFLDLDTVEITAPKRNLQLGESVPLTVEAKLNDGTLVPVTNSVYVESGNPEVVNVTDNGQPFTVTALAEGSAVVSAEMTYEGTTQRGELTFYVGEVPEPGAVYTYDFKQPVDSTIETAGWEITDYLLPLGAGSYRHQVYGIQVQAGGVGQYIEFDIMVPESGIYQVKFNGAGASGGAVGTVRIDGEPAGDYPFYSANYVQEKGQVSIKTFELDSGIHKLRLEVKEQAGYYALYPGELQLVETGGFPDLQSIDLVSDVAELMVGQKAELIVKGTLADGFAYNLNKVDQAVKAYVSSDESVAMVDADGNVSAAGEGETVITASVTLNGTTMQDQFLMTVNNKQLASVQVTASPHPIVTGESAVVAVTGYDNEGGVVALKDANVHYASRDESIAVVDPDGTVTAVSEGETVIDVTVVLGQATVQGSIAITVVPPLLAQIEASLLRNGLFVGDHVQVNIRGSYGNGEAADLSDADITVVSSDETVVLPDAGTGIEVIGPGTATLAVTVTLRGVTLQDTIEVSSQEVSSSKTRSTYYTEEKIAAARSNILTYDWAISEKAGVVAEADKYAAMGYEQLWKLVTPQTLPRSYGVNQKLGSPITGKEINQYGNYPWLADTENHPWKLIDPSSGYMFPTNDFGAYYESGLDANGIFRQELADKSLLVNTLYPEKGSTWGVDDGNGWMDENGNRWTFIAYYNHWKLWRSGEISKAINSLRDAYVYTGDMKYARAGIVLLDRIADVYPEMDVSAYSAADFLNSHGGTGEGKVIGSIWETGLVKDFISAYDAFFPAIDDAEVIAFLSGKAEQYDLGVLKTSATGIKRNIEDGILRQVYPAVKNAQIRGNNGMHQTTLALAAVVLDTLPETKEWLDFNFQSGGLLSGPWRVTGGNVLSLLVNDVDRDGAGSEASPSYNNLWIGLFQEMADILDGYDLYPAADLYQNVKFRKMFAYPYPLMLSDYYFPLIGDTGNAGGPTSLLNQGQLIKAFEKYRDPVYAQLAYYLNGNRIEGIHGNIFTDNPEQIAQDIAAVIETLGPLNLGSTNLTGYGFAALRDGVNERRFSGLGYSFSQLEVTEATTGYQLYANSGTIQFNAEAAGHAIAFKFEVPKTDRYEINLKPFLATSYGLYDISIDGNIVHRFDFYGTSGATSEPQVIADMELTEGEHTIRFEGVGKRDDASNYKLGIIQMQLFDEAALTVKNDPKNKNTLRDVWMYYGRNTGHGHKDTLNIGMHAFGLNLLPELGYPEFADNNPRRHEWQNNTISHNTVVVDEGKQQNQIAAQPIRFHDGEMVKLVEVEAPNVYPQTELYRRTTAMIRVDDENSYAVDFFRVQGGEDHHFSFHAADAVVTTDGLQLTDQPTGTYAGADVEFGNRPADDSVSGGGYMGSGFHYLKNVARDEAPSDVFSVDWNVKDTWDIYGNGAGALTDVHLRLTMLGAMDDVALADGVPPQNKPGNPASMRYLIAHREGDNLESTFTSVIEPYKGERFIASIEAVPVTKTDGAAVSEHEVRAVKVTLTNGRTDYILSALQEDVPYMVDDTFQFRGGFGVYTLEDGRQTIGFIHGGQTFRGSVLDFTQELSTDNEVIADFGSADVDPAQIAGTYIYIENDGVRNASYYIKEATRLEDGTFRLDVGDVTLIRSWANPLDFEQGYIYDAAPGAGFRIPLAEEFLFIPTVATLEELLDSCITEGDVTGPMAAQLSNRLRQTAHHWENGRHSQAAHHLHKFLESLSKESLQQHIAEQARIWLASDAEAVLQQLES